MRFFNLNIKENITAPLLIMNLGFCLRSIIQTRKTFRQALCDKLNLSPFPRMHPVTVLPSRPPASPDHQEQRRAIPSASASTARQSVPRRPRKRQTRATSDDTSETRTQAATQTLCITATETALPNTSHVSKCADTLPCCHTGALPNMTHTHTHTLNPLPHVHIHNTCVGLYHSDANDKEGRDQRSATDPTITKRPAGNKVHII